MIKMSEHRQKHTRSAPQPYHVPQQHHYGFQQDSTVWDIAM